MTFYAFYQIQFYILANVLVFIKLFYILANVLVFIKLFYILAVIFLEGHRHIPWEEDCDRGIGKQISILPNSSIHFESHVASKLDRKKDPKVLVTFLLNTNLSFASITKITNSLSAQIFDKH
jgi:hypothetical protein